MMKRRDFLKLTGKGAIAVAAAPVLAKVASGSTLPEGLTVAKLKKAREILDAAEVPCPVMSRITMDCPIRVTAPNGESEVVEFGDVFRFENGHLYIEREGHQS